MKNKQLRNIGFLLILLSFLLAIVLIFLQTDPFNSSRDKIENKAPFEAQLIINYPQNETLFPPEIIAPTFQWRANTHTKNWLINISSSDKEIFSAYLFSASWKPDSALWEKIKAESYLTELTFNVSTSSLVDDSLVNISDQITFNFSVDSVKSPLFYRQLNLPFQFVSKHLTTIEWCLGDISNYNGVKTLLTGTNTCGNCHSFSADAGIMGIDFDYKKDRGGYASFPITKDTKIEKQHFHSWNNRSNKGSSSSGLLSSVSPNGRYVVSTVNDQAISLFENNGFRFFPIKGILSVYDRFTDELWELEGANDSLYVQCNAVWSPDGTSIIFAKSPILTPEMLNDAEYIKGLANGEIEYQYNLWKIPFNEGSGGWAQPVKGASNNGKSNYFPKASPDGKWIVFTQAHSYMFREMDSKLVIVPFEGGEARELESNLPAMNSWHTWSPNSKWLAFSTKGFSNYTKIALTHIDTLGNASPAIFLENMVNETRAANIPEFVNIQFNDWNSISLDFLKLPIIEYVNIKQLKNGVYGGDAILTGDKLKPIEVRLETKIKDAQIVYISIVDSKGLTEKSERLIEKIIVMQTLNLEKLEAEGTEELVILKAISNSLK